MNVIIAVIVSIIGCTLYNIDFCTLHTFVSIAIVLSQKWTDYSNDKTALR